MRLHIKITDTHPAYPKWLGVPWTWCGVILRKFWIRWGKNNKENKKKCCKENDFLKAGQLTDWPF